VVQLLQVDPLAGSGSAAAAPLIWQNMRCGVCKSKLLQEGCSDAAALGWGRALLLATSG
jgi:hypothetical protein